MQCLLSPAVQALVPSVDCATGDLLNRYAMDDWQVFSRWVQQTESAYISNRHHLQWGEIVDGMKEAIEVLIAMEGICCEVADSLTKAEWKTLPAGLHRAVLIDLRQNYFLEVYVRLEKRRSFTNLYGLLGTRLKAACFVATGKVVPLC